MISEIARCLYRSDPADVGIAATHSYRCLGDPPLCAYDDLLNAIEQGINRIGTYTGDNATHIKFRSDRQTSTPR